MLHTLPVALYYDIPVCCPEPVFEHIPCSEQVVFQKPFLETSAAEFTRVVDTNLLGTFLTGRTVGRAMAAQVSSSSSSSSPQAMHP